MILKNIKTSLLFLLIFIAMISIVPAQKLEFSKYLVSNDEVHSSPVSAADKMGNIYVIGGTRVGLTVTDDAFQKRYKGHSNSVGGDVFLMKLSPDGELLYSTYIGGLGNDAYAGKIVFDRFENIYLIFTTDSKNLPVSPNALQSYNKGNNDHYIVKFNNKCEYVGATYLGGTEGDLWPAIYINNDLLYVVGTNERGEYPVTKGVVQETFNEWTDKSPAQPWMVKDITISVISLDLDKLHYSTYFGGGKYEAVNDLKFDTDGNLILVGSTSSDNFPVSQNGLYKKINGKLDMFFAILKSDLTKIIYSTYIGGNEDDNMPSLISFHNNEIIMSGNTKSSDFVTTKDALYNNFGGVQDGIIVKFNIKTNKLIYSSFIGGAGEDIIMYSGKTQKGKYLLAGRTNSTDFPVTENAIAKKFNGGKDLMFIILDETLKKIDYGTYFGGSKDDTWQAAPKPNLTKDDQLLITTVTSSSDFPTTGKIADIPSFEMIYLVKIDLRNEY